MHEHVGWDANAGVFDGDYHIPILPVGRQRYPASWIAEFGRIREQVPEHLSEPQLVGVQIHGLFRQRYG